MSGLIPYSSSDEIAARHTGGVVAIGNFDGLHRGHQELLSVARNEALRTGKAWGLLTFEPHPRSYFKPQEPVFRLTPKALKVRLAKALGADFVLCLDFDEAMAASPPEDFILRHLVEQLHVSHVVTGYDFHFGKGRKGTPETLRSMGGTHGFAVTVVDQVTDDGDGRAPFGSSSVRSALRRGHIREAARELGYHWIVMGEVVHGDKRGRTIGFPTANIVLDPGAEPFRGIYAVEVRDAAAADGGAPWVGAAYFGDRPTFNTNRTFLEVYLLDQDIDLYGRILLVSFVDMIRGDKTFRSVEELVMQMKDDCDVARSLVKELKQNDPCMEFFIGRLQRQGRV
jgi:riboflavin kinase / FMN adenylyltransferase